MRARIAFAALLVLLGLAAAAFVAEGREMVDYGLDGRLRCSHTGTATNVVIASHGTFMLKKCKAYFNSFGKKAKIKAPKGFVTVPNGKQVRLYTSEGGYGNRNAVKMIFAMPNEAQSPAGLTEDAVRNYLLDKLRDPARQVKADAKAAKALLKAEVAQDPTLLYQKILPADFDPDTDDDSACETRYQKIQQYKNMIQQANNLLAANPAPDAVKTSGLFMYELAPAGTKLPNYDLGKLEDDYTVDHRDALLPGHENSNFKSNDFDICQPQADTDLADVLALLDQAGKNYAQYHTLFCRVHHIMGKMIKNPVDGSKKQRYFENQIAIPDTWKGGNRVLVSPDAPKYVPAPPPGVGADPLPANGF